MPCGPPPKMESKWNTSFLLSHFFFTFSDNVRYCSVLFELDCKQSYVHLKWQHSKVNGSLHKNCNSIWIEWLRFTYYAVSSRINQIHLNRFKFSSFDSKLIVVIVCGECWLTKALATFKFMWFDRNSSVLACVYNTVTIQPSVINTINQTWQLTPSRCSLRLVLWSF